MSKLIKFSLVAVLSLGLMPNTSFAQEADEDNEDTKNEIEEALTLSIKCTFGLHV